MEFSDKDMERNRHQFDTLCKKVLALEAKSFLCAAAKRAMRELTFSDLTEAELNSLAITDEYPSDTARYQVLGFDIKVRDDLLVEALDALPPRKRDIILLAYFMEMNDAAIARLMKNDRSTVSYHRTSALEKLQKFMKQEDKPYGE